MTAHQVTHKNVIRIYDLAEADGVKFTRWSMSRARSSATAEGTRKIFADEAVDMIRNVCMALDAGAQRRHHPSDLKPQNIMQDKQAGILVMDFGLARSVSGSEGMTQTGALFGHDRIHVAEQAWEKLSTRLRLFAVA